MRASMPRRPSRNVNIQLLTLPTLGSQASLPLKSQSASYVPMALSNLNSKGYDITHDKDNHRRSRLDGKSARTPAAYGPETAFGDINSAEVPSKSIDGKRPAMRCPRVLTGPRSLNEAQLRRPFLLPLRGVLLQPLACVCQVILVDDIVAVENVPGKVAADPHGLQVLETGFLHIANGAPAQVMKEQAGHARTLAGFRPAVQVGVHGMILRPVEHPDAVLRADFPLPFDPAAHVAIDGQGTRLFVLRYRAR